MRKIFFILIISLFTYSIGFSQIDDLKKKSDETDKSNNNSESFTPDLYCLSSCLQTTFNFMFSVVGQALFNHHLQIMNSITDPSKLSFDVSPAIAYGLHYNKDSRVLYDYFNVLPQIHGRWGVLSTDFRYNLLLDFQDFTVDAFKSWEWNIIQINIQPADEHLITFGTGIAFETSSKSIYNENLFSYRYKTLDQMYFGQFTCRFSTDYSFYENSTDAFFFTEINLNGGIKFLTTTHLFGYITFGLIYQNYYLSHNIFLAQGGLNFNIH